MTAAFTPDATPDVGPYLQVRPATGHIGADITGVDLPRPLDPGTIAAIRAAVLRWKVVFFRDQPIDHIRHVEFVRAFGPLRARTGGPHLTRDNLDRLKDLERNPVVTEHPVVRVHPETGEKGLFVEPTPASPA